jgi:2-dehydropantoate 2-reductase
MVIKSAAIIGAGAIGCYFITGLRKTLGDQFYVLAEGERLERLKEDGIIINGERVPLQVRLPEEAAGVDLIIVAVKYGALPEAISMLEKAVGENTVVLCPMNGVDCEERIAETIGPDRIIDSMIKIQSHRIGNSVNFDPEITAGIYLGERDGKVTKRVEALSELFGKSGINYHLCEDIIKTIWLKYALNISKNLPQAIINCGYGAYVKSEHMMHISEKLRAEVAAVAKAKGIDITDRDDAIGKSIPVPDDSRYSTLQDLDAKRPTEIDMFSGALCRMGEELGVPTPFNDFAFHAIKALEEKNSGLFS